MMGAVTTGFANSQTSATCAGEQIVEALLGNQPQEVAMAGRLIGLCNVPSGEVAAADIDDLSLLHVRGLRTPVHVYGVDEIDPGLQSLVHDLEGGGLVRHHAEVYRAKTQPADLEPRSPKMCVRPLSLFLKKSPAYVARAEGFVLSSFRK